MGGAARERSGIEWSFLRSRLGRTLFVLFLICAMTPMVLLSALSYRRVVAHLEEQTDRRLHQQAKGVAMSVVERLLFLEAALEMVAEQERAGAEERRRTALTAAVRERFSAVARVIPGGSETLLGSAPPFPAPDARQRQHLGRGRTLLTVGEAAGAMAVVDLARAVDPDNLERGIVWGAVAPEYLWDVGVRSTLPPQTELSVVDDQGRFLVRSEGIPDDLVRRLTGGSGEGAPAGRIGGYLVRSWTIPMETNYLVGSWTVVLAQRREYALAPLAQFRRNFPLILLLSLLIVVLLSTRQIRRSLLPLLELRDGTRQVARGDFSRRVSVKSGDEIEELAAAFNAMTAQLGIQFAELNTLAAVGRSVLGGAGPQAAVQVLLTGVRAIFRCDVAAVTLAEGGARLRRTVLRAPEGEGGEGGAEGVTTEELPASPAEPYEATLAATGFRSVVSAVLEADGQPIGSLTLAARRPGAFAPVDPRRLGELADHLALALRHLRLGAELEAERARLEGLVEQLPNGVLLLDEARRLRLVNRLARSALPSLTSAVVGERLVELGGLPLAELERGAPQWRELALDQGGGRRTFVVAAGRLAGSAEGWSVVVLREVTAEREVEERLRRQERLAAVGQLAAGIAHDLNNVLQGVLLSAELLGSAERQEERDELLATIIEQSGRASDLIRQVLDFSRRSTTDRRPLELGPVVKEMVRLLARTLPETIDLRCEVDARGALVLADPAQIQQVVTNLVLNARDALPQGGEIEVTVGRRIYEEGAALPQMAAGEWITLSVADTGVGIPPEVRDKVFDPFFTTKPVGQGTGLGLAQVYGIVEQHGGRIDFATEVGAGTTFTVFLPLHVAAEGEELPTVASETPAGGEQLVLVVEDDPTVLSTVEKTLAALGYRVMTASDGRRALAAFHRHRERLALVLSDVVMPDMGGRELLRRVRAVEARLPVVLMSGYPGPEGDDPDSVLWLHKPFSRQELARVIRSALVSPGGRSG